MKNVIIAVLAVLLVGGIAIYFIMQPDDRKTHETEDAVTDRTNDEEDNEMDDEDEELPSESVLGQSVEGTDIMAYHYGQGDDELLFVGGIHGGYSWNTSLTAYELIDYLEANEADLPENLRVTVVPVLNPDGLEAVVGTTGRFDAATAQAATNRAEGRFNANNVDLNRNFDCNWEAESMWQSQTVSGGSGAFSEPEAAAIRDYVGMHRPEAVVVYYSAGGGVYASSCATGVSSETSMLTNLYADAADYEAYEEFDYYEITGDMVNWLAKTGIPAISVLLTNHTNPEWNKNQAGVEAMLEYYGEDAANDTDE